MEMDQLNSLPEVEAIELAVAAANAERENNLKAIRKAARNLMSSEAIAYAELENWVRAAQLSRFWLMMAWKAKPGRPKYPDLLSAPVTSNPRRPTFATNDARGAEMWLKEVLAEKARKMRSKEGSRLSVHLQSTIHKELQKLPRPNLIFRFRGGRGRLVQGENDEVAIAPWAAFGAALLLDHSAGFQGKEKFIPYISRFGLCARPACGRFFFHGPGSRGGQHFYCSDPKCGKAMRQAKYRSLKKKRSEALLGRRSN